LAEKIISEMTYRVSSIERDVEPHRFYLLTRKRGRGEGHRPFFDMLKIFFYFNRLNNDTY